MGIVTGLAKSSPTLLRKLFDGPTLAGYFFIFLRPDQSPAISISCEFKKHCSGSTFAHFRHSRLAAKIPNVVSKTVPVHLQKRLEQFSCNDKTILRFWYFAVRIDCFCEDIMRRISSKHAPSSLVFTFFGDYSGGSLLRPITATIDSAVRISNMRRGQSCRSRLGVRSAFPARRRPSRPPVV